MHKRSVKRKVEASLESCHHGPARHEPTLAHLLSELWKAGQQVSSLSGRQCNDQRVEAPEFAVRVILEKPLVAPFASRSPALARQRASGS